MNALGQIAAGILVLVAVSVGSQWYAVDQYKKSLIEQAKEADEANAAIVEDIIEEVQNEDRDGLIDALSGFLRGSGED